MELFVRAESWEELLSFLQGTELSIGPFLNGEACLFWQDLVIGRVMSYVSGAYQVWV